MRRYSLPSMVALLILIAASASSQTPTWTDITASTPLGDPGRTMGCAWGDYDGDGDDDLYVANDSTANRLYRNEGSGVFVDVTAPPLDDEGRGTACVWGDYDGDGDLDLYLSNNGPNRLFRNDGAAGFSDQTVAPLDDAAMGNCVSWADFDQDGDLDLCLANINAANRLFRNDGAGAFSDVAPSAFADAGAARAVVWGDYDNDRDPDLYVGIAGVNVLLRNDDGVLVEATPALLADTGNTCGAAWGDLDNDGRLDLYVANAGVNRLFRNGESGFEDWTSAPVDDGGAGRSVAWLDVDHDGDLDLYLTNQNSSDRIFRNDGGSFVDATDAVIGDTGYGHGAGLADVDGDGDLDVHLCRYGQSNRLLLNDGHPTNHWLQCSLVDSDGRPAGIGARVRLVAGGATRISEIAAGSGYLSQHTARAHFGLGASAVVDTLQVRWPGSGVTQHTVAAADQHLVLSPPGSAFWFVAVDGSDTTGDGSPGAPFATIVHAVGLASSGDTIILMAGTFSGDGNRDVDFGGKQLVLTSQSGEPGSVVLDCAVDAPDPHVGFLFTAEQGGETVIRGITIDGAITSADAPGAITYRPLDPTLQYDSGPRVVACRIVGSTGQGVHVGREDGLDEIHAATIDSCVVEACADEGIYFAAGTRLGRIDACQVTDCGTGIALRSRYGTQIAGSSVTDHDGAGIFCVKSVQITDCDVSGNGGAGIAGADEDDPPPPPSSDLWLNVSGCSIRENAASGIQVPIGYLTVTNSDLADNGASGFRVIESDADHGTIQLTDVLITGNQYGVFVPTHFTFGGTSLTLDRVTIADNDSWALLAGNYWASTSVSLQRCLLAANGATISVGDFESMANLSSVSCTDVWGHPGDDWSGPLLDFAYDDGNLSSDPQFCGPDNPDDPYTLAASSPCAEANTPDCGRIGARDVGCEAAGFVIAGNVLDEGDEPLAGVVLAGFPTDVVTDGSGQYTTVVAASWPGATVVPSKPAYSFDPPSRTYGPPTGDLLAEDYAAVRTGHVVSGRVSGQMGLPVAGVLMLGLPDSVYTDSDGLFEVGVPDGFSGHAIPWKPGYCFLPSSRTLDDVHEDRWAYFSTQWGDPGRFVDVAEGDIASVGPNRGAAWVDVDDDGDDDLYLIRNGAANQLLLASGGGTFTADTPPLLADLGYGVGASWGDYDRDGDRDLYLCNSDSLGVLSFNRLFANQGGGVFTDITVGDVQLPGLVDQASWVDVDRDGWLDIYVSRDDGGVGASNLLLRGSQDLATDTPPALAVSGENSGFGWADFDGDGRLDCLLARPADESVLFLQQADGSFMPSGQSLMLAGATSVTCVDADSDGDFDAFVTQWEGPNRLLVNDGTGLFDLEQYGELTDNRRSIGSLWADFDNDGNLDVFVQNHDSPDEIYYNLGYDDYLVYSDAILVLPGLEYGASLCDFDGDGAIDLFIPREDQPSWLLRNQIGGGSHWLRVRLVGDSRDVDALGSVVRLYREEEIQTRQVVSYAGRSCQNPPWVQFGLGGNTQVDSLVVTWPDGGTTTVQPSGVDQLVLVHESPLVGVDEPGALPDAFALHSCVPNPFNPATALAFDLPRPSRVWLEVFDLRGRRIAVVIAGAELAAGSHTVEWRGRDEHGRDAASGVYLARLQVGAFQQTVRMMLVR